jgi:hypothetical protein
MNLLPCAQEDWDLVVRVHTEHDHRGIRRTAIIAHRCLDPDHEALVLLTQIWPGLVPDGTDSDQSGGGPSTQPDA